MATEQQFCLKWNNHRSTLFSVFETLLEEDNLVDVTLSADGQFLRAHRVILSACSPYFRVSISGTLSTGSTLVLTYFVLQTLFKQSFLSDKHPVIILRDVDFENLRSLVEYMYKGEANVPQHMLPSFIKTAETLQIRGLAECASKQFEAENNSTTSNSVTSTPTHSTPALSRGTKRGSQSNAVGGGQNTPAAAAAQAAAAAALGPGGILAARLANPAGIPGMLDFTAENFPGLLPRNFGQPPAPHLPPSMKKSRKSDQPRPRGQSPIKASPGKLKAKSGNVPGGVNNNSYPGSGGGASTISIDDEGVLKIDEDVEAGKENRASPSTGSKIADDDIAEIEHSNGVSDEEEEPSMPGPGGELPTAGT